MTEFSHQRRLTALKNAKASLSIEGIRYTQIENDLLVKRVFERMSHSEFLERAVEVAKNVKV